MACTLSHSILVAEIKPNIVIIFIDDMGYGDIGPYGATKQRTPNLDRMAHEGMKLTSFYAAPVCSVSRAQLLTGCYGARVSVPSVYGPGNKNGLNPSEYTIAERLKEQGYASMCIGKWHVGDQPAFLPTKQGFDRYFGFPYSNDMQRADLQTGEKVIPLLRDEKVIELLNEEGQTHIVERYTNEAVHFIRENQDKPFLLYLPHTAVHTPIHPGAAFVGKSANGQFGDWVEEVDWSVGRVLDTLRQLKLDDHTLVVFTSDNGPWLIKGKDAGSAGPLRGGKGSTWEGGMRVPTIAWWPGKIAADSVSDAVAGTIDLMPTAVALAGGKLPVEPVVDGRDISPLLFGQAKQSAREAHYYFSGYKLQAVRQGAWKLAITPQNETMGKKPAADASGKEPRLYNLDEEIGEKTNVASAHPEVVAKLQALAEKMDAEIGGDAPVSRRPAGVVETPVTLYPTASEKPKANKKDKPVGNLKSRSLCLSDMKIGDVLEGQSAPQIANKSLAIRCTINTEQRDAIILAQGGIAAGYALHLKGGQVVFTVRSKGITDLTSSVSIGGSSTITATLSKDATMTLRVNNAPAVTSRASDILRRQPQEDFCLGHDNAKPVGDYSASEPFMGSITDLKIVTD